MFFRKRALGVKEANAIDDIIVYEWKRDRGLLITTPEKLAYREAWQIVERREPLTMVDVAQKMRTVMTTKVVSSHDEDDYDYEIDDDEEETSLPPVTRDPSFKVAAYIVVGFTAWMLLAGIYSIFS